jgi:hypothetical protein
MTEEKQIAEWNRKNAEDSPDRLTHKRKLAELGEHCNAIVALVDDYFQPPNLMAWRGDGDWEVFIRRKGSSVEFGPSEWEAEETL